MSHGTREPDAREVLDYTALGLAALKAWPRRFRRTLQREGHWEDLLQTVALSAWEAKLGRLSPQKT
jgi:hypothetical protein